MNETNNLKLEMKILSVLEYKRFYPDVYVALNMDGMTKSVFFGHNNGYNGNTLLINSKNLFNYISPEDFFKIPGALTSLADFEILTSYGFSLTRDLVRKIPKDLKSRYNFLLGKTFLSNLCFNEAIHIFDIELTLTKKRLVFKSRFKNKEEKIRILTLAYKALVKYQNLNKKDRKICKNALEALLSYFPVEIKLMAAVSDV